jgi:hypothetical protein
MQAIHNKAQNKFQLLCWLGMSDQAKYPELKKLSGSIFNSLHELKEAVKSVTPGTDFWANNSDEKSLFFETYDWW